MSQWQQLAESFPESEVKQRQGPRQHADDCTKRYGQCTKPHRMLSYVDARAVMNRLDEVLTPEGWDFQTQHVGGNVVHGRLIVFVGERAVTREDFGYPNGADDTEPIKSASSDALKRCAVGIGIGRHLYSDNTTPRPSPQPQPATVSSSSTVAGDGSWVCPEHGDKKVRSNRRGLFCAWVMGKDAEGKAIFCTHTDQERPVEARPRPVEAPEEPSDLWPESA